MRAHLQEKPDQAHENNHREHPAKLAAAANSPPPKLIAYPFTLAGRETRYFAFDVERGKNAQLRIDSSRPFGGVDIASSPGIFGTPSDHVDCRELD